MLKNKYEFCKTDDNSVGLFDKNAGDILHSKTGALKEAFDKFVLPANLISKYLKDINVLDICYGIGYNSKAFLYKNLECNIHIDALEYDRELIFISPFISDEIMDFDLKYLITKNILRDNSLKIEFIDYLKSIDIEKDNKNFSAFILPFIQFLNTGEYVSKGSDVNRSFLHNIYCQ